MTNQIQATVTLLSLINPAVCVVIFSKIEAEQSKAQKLADATKAVVAVAVILLISALLGNKALNIFGISLNAFKVAGGCVLAWMGFSMLSGGAKEKDAAPSVQAGQSLNPLIMFAASPGTITGVITLSVDHASHALPMSALIAVVLSSILLWGSLALFSQFGKESQSGGFVRDTITRFMGLIVIAMGVQFILTGIDGFFKFQN